MQYLSAKKLLRLLIERLGYDIKLHPIATAPYKGKKVAYIHIAKCGGMSIDSALRSAFASTGQHKLNRAAAIQTTLTHFSQDVESPENSAKFADEHVKTLNTLMSYYLGLNWSYMSGHANISSQQLKKHAENYHFLTVLRDPIERFISHYIYTKLTNTLPVMLPNKFLTDNLVDEALNIIESRRGWHMMNTPTMCLTGQYPKNSHEAKVMQSTVADNLSQFSVVGFLSDLPRFTQQVEDLTGKSIVIAHQNASNSYVDEEQQRVRRTLTEFFNETSTRNKLKALGESEIENFTRAQALYLGSN